jgi:hypothetical protein
MLTVLRRERLSEKNLKVFFRVNAARCGTKEFFGNFKLQKESFYYNN